MNPKVDEYLSTIKNWQKEIEQLRRIVLSCGLTEELKWRAPCYSFQKNNIIIIGSFKEFCALSFFKGVLLKDTNDILIQQGANTQSVRIIRFSNVQEIIKLESILKAYIHEAIEIEKAGLKVEFKDKTVLKFPEELQNELDNNPTFKTAFEALTPGRQRGYNLYFSAPKQSKTRVLRIKKCTPKILKGKGLNDCTCGLSKRMPNCDGSHKYI